MDERDLGWLEEVLRSFVEPQFVKNDYVRRLGETVLSLARQGSAVFIGRGVDLILPRDMGLRIRIVAPRERRIRTMAERQGISPADARRALERLEHERAQFIERHFRAAERDPERYDLMINLDRISQAQAVDLIETAHKALVSP